MKEFHIIAKASIWPLRLALDLDFLICAILIRLRQDRNRRTGRGSDGRQIH